MRRWVSGAMALIITFTCAQGSFAVASGEAGETVVSAVVEAATDSVVAEETPEPDVPLDAAEYELPIDEPEAAVEPEAAPEAVPEAVALPRYAALAVDTPVLGAPEGAALMTLVEAGTALVLDAAGGWPRVALYTDRGVVIGCVAEASLRVLEPDETAAYLDALASGGAVALYEDDIDRPLAWTACAFPEAGEEAAEAPAGEATEETIEETAEVPAGEIIEEPAEESAVEVIDAPVEEIAEVPEEALTEEPAETVNEEPAEAENEEPAIEAAEEPVEEPDATPEPEGAADESAVEAPAAQEPIATEQPAAEPAAAEPTPEPAATEQPTAEPVAVEPAAEPAAEPAESAEPTESAFELTEVEGVEYAASGADIQSDGAAEAEALAAAGMRLNRTACVLGLKESYSGLAVTGATGAVTWSTSNKKIVKVNAQTGVVKGVKKGSAVITAKGSDGKTASIKVTVKGAPKKIKFKEPKLSMGAGGMSVALQLVMTKGTASAGTVYTSSNPEVVTVDESGVATSHGVGSAVITATSYNHKRATCSVTVFAEPSRVEMPSEFSLAVSQNSTLGVQAYAADGSRTDAGLTFQIESNSPNPACISVDGENGVIVGVGQGTAYVTALTHNGLSCGPCEVSVTADAVAIKLPAKAAIGLKETHEALPVELISASGGSDCAADITWSSSNKKIVSVDPDTGVLTGLKKGTATIVAKTHNGLKAKCKVTVKKAPTKVAISPTSASLDVGGTLKFAYIVPKGTADGCAYTSSNPAVATIDESGLAKAVAAGSTTITVTTYNGLTATATLTVKGAAGTDDSGATSTETPSTGGNPDVEVPEALEKLGIASYTNVYREDMTNAEKLEYIIYMGQTQLGKPYVYGKGYKTANPTGFDCSGFVYWCYYRIGIQLGDSAYKQGYDNRYTKITEISDLRRGDVVCFNTSSDSDLSDHTGIYLGNGYFIHASSGSSKRKVVVQRMYNDSISSDYYKRNFSWGRRILN